MSASENRRSVVVGIFVLLGVIILVAGILILGGQQKRFGGSIRVHAVFNNVGGLKEGNNVWFSGVKIGTIKKISFTADRNVEIVMSIESASQPYIRKDAIAQISSEGFIGNKIIVLLGGSSQAPNVEDGDLLASKEGNDTDAMMATLQVNNENLVAITADIKKLTERVRNGEGVVGALFTDSTLATNLQATMANLNRAAIQANGVATNLNRFTAHLNQEGTFVNDLLTDTVLFNQLRNAVAKLDGITQHATAVTENLQMTSERLNQKDNAVGVLLNDPEAATQLKEILENLKTSSEKLDQNMEALQHNFLFRGYFRKQNK